MPSKKRIKTKYPGVYFIEGKAAKGISTERIYYIVYRRNGKLIEEKAGRQHQDDMTPAKASGIRARRIEGKELPNKARREKNNKVVRWTIERLWNEYRAQLPGGRESATDRSRWNLHLKKKFAQKEPKELIKLDIDRLRINLLKRLSPQSTKHVLALLRRIIKFGSNSGYTAPLSFEIKMPPVDNVRTEDLSPDQLQQLFKVLETTHHLVAANIMRLALFTGLRRGEIFKLKWEDINFHNKFILLRNPKGGISQKIPLNKSAKGLIETIPRIKDSEYLFPSRKGGPRKDISKAVRAIKEEAGLPDDFRPLHGLRHVYASMLASSGKVDMYTLQKLMTHKSPQMTQRYAHLRDQALKRAADVTDGILDEITGTK